MVVAPSDNDITDAQLEELNALASRLTKNSADKAKAAGSANKRRRTRKAKAGSRHLNRGTLRKRRG